jgi:hypothetical protein
MFTYALQNAQHANAASDWHANAASDGALVSKRRKIAAPDEEFSNKQLLAFLLGSWM